MSDFEPSRDGAPVVSMKAVELALALFTASLGALVMYGSHQQGIGWNDTGPESGYFPFYIGLIMAAASLGTIVITLLRWRALTQPFIARGPFTHVIAVFFPMCAYGVGIRLMGMYLASAVFIAWFMWRANGGQRHGMLKIVLIPAAVVIAAYLIFERWFQVPLYAGPLVEWLGAAR